MLKSMSVRATLVAIAWAISFSAHALADAPRQIAIPAGDLRQGLLQLSKEYGVELVYQPELIKDYRTGGVQGNYTAPDAVRLLLKGTPLELRTDPSGAMLIAPPRTNTTSSSQQTAGDAAAKEVKSGADSFRVAQLDQGQAAGFTPVEGRNEETPKETEEKREREQLQEVIVTGTHIKGSSNPTAPMIVIDRGEIQRSGFVSTQQLVANIPQNFGGGSAGASEDGSLGSGFLAGINDVYGTGINLHGLGNSSTLVLVDGHRLAPSSAGLFVDVSTIPLAAIDRVEMMTDGASAIYGADAVAGVVNFILRKEYNGQGTWLTYGPDIDGSRRQQVIGQSLGRNWSDGNVLATVQYQALGAVTAAERSYTSSAPEPTNLLPKSDQYSATLNARQDLGAGFELTGDVLYSRENRSGDFAHLPSYIGYNSSDTDAGVATLDLAYRPSEKWRVDLTASYSREHTLATTAYSIHQFCKDTSGMGVSCVLDDNFAISSTDLVASGTIVSTAAGDVKAALGGSYRDEALSYDPKDYLTPYDINGGRPRIDRHVSAEFAELEVPIVGQGNAGPMFRSLELSAAVRHDKYSDFGSTTNPRYGLAWKPVDDLVIRSSYSTSFRAPTAYEQIYSIGLPAGVFQLDQASPSGGTVPVFYQYGGGPPLKPERARSITTGFDFKPSLAPNFDSSFNYFDIKYSDRILVPSFDAAALSELNVYGSLITPFPSDSAAEAFINETLSKGGVFYNFSSSSPAGVNVRYLFNNYELNAVVETIAGFDWTARYNFSVGGNNFRVTLNTAYISHIDVAYTPGATETNIVNTYSNPLHWRGRGQIAWSRQRWSANAALNFSGAYVDTTTASHPPVSSWTTVDAQIGYALPVANDLRVSLSGSNVFNRVPPYVDGANQALAGIHYDVGNANPLGRVFVLSMALAW